MASPKQASPPLHFPAFLGGMLLPFMLYILVFIAFVFLEYILQNQWAIAVYVFGMGGLQWLYLLPLSHRLRPAHSSFALGLLCGGGLTTLLWGLCMGMAWLETAQPVLPG